MFRELSVHLKEHAPNVVVWCVKTKLNISVGDDFFTILMNNLILLLSPFSPCLPISHL